jgi:hypothetical protein
VTALIHLSTEREIRRVPTHTVIFDSDRAAKMHGELYRTQRLYFWTEREAQDFAAENTLNGGPARVEEF